MHEEKNLRRAARSLCGAGALVLVLGGCDAVSTDKTPERVRNGISELDLTVTGRPTPGSLALTEHVLARLMARDADGLAGLALEDGDAQDDAERWVARWGDAAQRPATADFSVGEKDATVDIHFTGEASALSLLLIPNDEDDAYADSYVVALDTASQVTAGSPTFLTSTSTSATTSLR
ncbi:hypothetical protein AB0A69_32470 [Streptomyces sp. NPDC045431]|uniref:hypothetical protein n=1 Tax=Streptomyces sp. NPDC045431 TaxID=3155613 RepID=UPI0033EC6ECD